MRHELRFRAQPEMFSLTRDKLRDLLSCSIVSTLVTAFCKEISESFFPFSFTNSIKVLLNVFLAKLSLNVNLTT